MTKTLRHRAFAFLRKMISPYGYATKDARGFRRPTNEQLVYDYNTRGYIRGLNNTQMLDHFECRETHYFWGDGRIRTPRALISIDVDCHKIGTLDAALEFARHLRESLFPGLYFESSTNGNGVHGYLIIEKKDFGDERLHGLCVMLDKTLKVVHREWQDANPDLKVEGVEIKGHPPRIYWTRDGMIKEFTSGQFVKLPREMLSRFEEFSRTTVLGSFQVSDLYKRYERAPEIKGKPVEKQYIASHSLTGCVVKKVDLERWDAYLDLSRTLVPSPLKTSGRDVATSVDMAIFLMILEACTNSLNADGSMPTARIRENWEILHSNGEVERPWNPKRYTALRNHLSRAGHLDWEDPHYLPGPLSPTNEGQAAKWQASESLMRRIADAKSLVVQVAGGRADSEVFSSLEGEEDLYGDNQEEEPVSAWFIRMKRSKFIRPVLDPDIGRLRLAG